MQLDTLSKLSLISFLDFLKRVNYIPKLGIEKIQPNLTYDEKIALNARVKSEIKPSLGTIQVLRHQRGGWVGWQNDDV